MILFKECITSFIFHCKYEKRLSDNTLKFYQIDLIQFDGYILAKSFSSLLGDIDKEILRGYIQHISIFKPKTIKRKIATLKVLFNYLEFEDKIIINPFRKLKIKLKEPITLPKSMNINEVKMIFKSVYQAVRLQGKLIFSQEANRRDIAIIELLFATGMRVSELVNLKVIISVILSRVFRSKLSH